MRSVEQSLERSRPRPEEASRSFGKVNEPRSIPTTIAEPSFSLRPIRVLLIRGPTIPSTIRPTSSLPVFPLLSSVASLASTKRHRLHSSASAPFILPPHPRLRFPLRKLAKSFSPSPFERRTSRSLFDSCGGKNPQSRKISMFANTERSRRNDISALILRIKYIQHSLLFLHPSPSRDYFTIAISLLRRALLRVKVFSTGWMENTVSLNFFADGANV